MQKIVSIDENTRIKIISGNFILQRLSVGKSKKSTAWKYEGYFTTLESLSNYYLNSSSYRTIEGTRSFRELIKVVKSAQEELKVLINNL
jgi:hypothetical protein